MDSADDVVRKIRAADTRPGIRSNLKVGQHEATYFLYGATKCSEAVEVSSFPKKRPYGRQLCFGVSMLLDYQTNGFAWDDVLESDIL